MQAGQVASKELLTPVVNKMVEILEESVGIRPRSMPFGEMATNKSIKDIDNITNISFTGGVAESIYRPTNGDLFQYGDIGLMLGEAIKESPLTYNLSLVEPAELLRAKDVSAGTHTTEI